MTDKERMDFERQRFATELLHEVKLNAKRWFIAFCIMIAVEIITIFGFMWYISLPVEEVSTTQTATEIDSGTVTQIGGDSYGESDANEDLQEESNEK